MIFRLALKQLLTTKRANLLFALSLGVGLLSFLTLTSFKDSVETSIAESSKEFLSADLTVYARQGVSESQLSLVKGLLPQGTEETDLLEMYSMVRAEKTSTSRLVLVKAIDQPYPFYGDFLLESTSDYNSAKKSLFGDEAVVWVVPELLVQFGVSVGDRLKIGVNQFRIEQVVNKAPGETRAGAGLAPAVFIAKKYIDSTDLIKKGSTFYRSHLFKLPKGFDAEELEKEINTVLTDPAVNVRSHITASEGASRLIVYLNDYLGLVSLVALFLSIIGVFYLFRSRLAVERKNIAILRSLGLRAGQVLWIYRLQLVLLGILSLLPALFVSWFVIPYLNQVVGDFVAVDVEANLTLASIIFSLLIALVLSQLIGYPLLKRLSSLPVNQLFGESDGDQKLSFRSFSWLDFLPLVLSFWALAILQSNSFKIGSLFSLSFFVSFIVLSIVFLLLSYWLKNNIHFKGLEFKLAKAHLVTNKLGSLSCFLAIGLGVLLISFVDQIESSLQKQLDLDTFADRPSLFAFDIQENQVEVLKKIVDEKNLKIDSLSPLVRGRLIAVNGEGFERKKLEEFETREQERERRSRNRGINLSYREGVFDSEEVVEGVGSLGTYSGTGMPLVSVEKDYAKRLNLKIGDLMTFDVQGVEIQSKVANLRKVKWASFQPNFFISFQPGVLNEAPKTFLATLPQMNDDLKQEIQFSIVSALPNISLIDVSRTLERLLEIIIKMSWALKFMAYLSILAGFFVLFSITQHQVFLRKPDMNLLMVLGLTKNRLVKSVLFEVLSLIFTSVVVGMFVSYLLAFLCSYFVFDGGFSPVFVKNLVYLLIILFFGFVVSVASVRSHTMDRHSL